MQLKKEIYQVVEDFGIGYGKVNSDLFGLELSGSGVSLYTYDL